MYFRTPLLGLRLALSYVSLWWIINKYKGVRKCALASFINEFSSIANPLRNIDKTSVTCDILSIFTQQFDTKFKIVLQQMEKGFKSCIFQSLNQNWNICVI